MRIVLKTCFLLLCIGLFTSCEDDKPNTVNGPFSNGSDERNMIIVISDLHIGADLSYAEINDNLKPLEDFLEQIRVSPNVKELVIAGDLLDEWFVPATTNTYEGKDQSDFVQRIATVNKGVFDAFNSIIKAGKIKVTYVPGNHDLTITPENIALILPGINQVRDPELGLGTYSPTDFPKLAIEHGHRYNFFCAPDPISNQDVAPGTILPPGYFFTRIAALSVDQNHPVPIDFPPVVTQNSSGGESQNLLFDYWKMWNWTVSNFPINSMLSNKNIVTNINGFTQNYSVNDLLPYQTTPGGLIELNLYKGIQDNWQERQTRNGVAVSIPTAQAIENSTNPLETDNQAQVQYFLNPNSDKRIVVFGHSHIPKIISSLNQQGMKCIYVNSGTWIDSNPNQTTMHFVVITPQNSGTNSQTYIKLYNFEGEVATEMSKDSLRL